MVVVERSPWGTLALRGMVMHGVVESSISLKRSLRSLIIEDSEDDAALLVGVLRRNGFDVSYERVDTMSALVSALDEDWDIIFSDHAMPTMNGMEALAKVREVNKDVPFIFVSATIGEDAAVESMRTGAQDYIMKDNLKRLIPAVRRELHDSQTRKGRREAEQRLHYLAHFDSLTGLPNRFFFIENLKLAIEQKKSKLIAVLYIDLDRFKTINDSLGYEAGNLLLKEVAKRLRQCVPERGSVARLAADEFALSYTQAERRSQVASFVQRVFDILETPYFIRGCSLYFSSSIGVAVFPDDQLSAEGLLGNADIATYRKKDEGGKGFQFYTPVMSVQLEERLGLERNMRVGFEKKEFSLHYQPQQEVSTGKIVGVEALLRWNSAEFGAVSPATFIPLAEETGFVLPLSTWVLQRACQQVKRWHNRGFSEMRVAVNISARQFHENNLVEMVSEILAEHDLPPSSLEIEITETTIIRDVNKAIDVLNRLQRLGVKVALDDFGTGYSSLSYLNSFKTDYLKIDQSFIRTLSHDHGSQAIVNAIIAMAEKLSIKTIAEGVENQVQYELLRQAGCDIIQGYHIAKPASEDVIEKMLG